MNLWLLSISSYAISTVKQIITPNTLTSDLYFTYTVAPGPPVSFTLYICGYSLGTNGKNGGS